MIDSDMTPRIQRRAIARVEASRRGSETVGCGGGEKMVMLGLEDGIGTAVSWKDISWEEPYGLSFIAMR